MEHSLRSFHHHHGFKNTKAWYWTINPTLSAKLCTVHINAHLVPVESCTTLYMCQYVLNNWKALILLKESNCKATSNEVHICLHNMFLFDFFCINWYVISLIVIFVSNCWRFDLQSLCNSVYTNRIQCNFIDKTFCGWHFHSRTAINLWLTWHVKMKITVFRRALTYTCAVS